MKIFNQTIGMSGTHISLVVANKGTTQDGLAIFKLLKQHKCPIHPLAIRYAATYSSLILDYMLQNKLYPNYIYLTQKLIVDTLRNARINLVHKNVLIIVRYLSNMKNEVSTTDYKQWIINMFYYIMMNGTMDGYFKMFKEMIEILLNEDDWKCFRNSKIIDKQLLMSLKQQIENRSNMRDVCDDKWCLLLKTMIDSFDHDDTKLLERYGDDELDRKTNDKDNDDNHHYCSENHLMNQVNGDDNNGLLSTKQCNYCNEMNVSFECVKCKEFICNECLNIVVKLIDLLKNEEFNQFSQILDQYNKIKQENMIKTVELYLQLIQRTCCTNLLFCLLF